ncbi:MAG: DUF2442 domain-containing protein [Candidatus Kapabacteria bacterium]|nr:DUF2442 domain-containing protein [Candidatus Kapabacteria bacterium]
MKSPKIIDAKYLEEYKLLLLFKNKSSKTVDFSEFLKNSHYPNEKRYLEKEKILQFKVDYGDLIWNDFDMCFQAKNLYNGILRK